MTPPDHLKKANTFFRSGHYQEALKHYASLLAAEKTRVPEEVNFNYHLTRSRLGFPPDPALRWVTPIASTLKPAPKPASPLDGEPTDFKGWLRRGFLAPIIEAPFTEAKKRAFAFMDVLAKHYEQRGLTEAATTKVTVLMATYNREDSLGSAIDSVLQQSHKQIQLIVIDDGSTDGTATVLRDYARKDPRIELVTTKTNSGKSAALNLATPRARGDWVAYLDSDNMWHPSFLAAHLGASIDEPEVDALFSGQYLYQGEDSTPYAARIAMYNKNLLLNRNYIDHNSFLHKRHLLQQVGPYNETLRRGIDYDFILRVIKSHKLASVPLVLTDYFYDNANKTITSDKSTIQDLHQVQESAQQLLTDPDWAARELLATGMHELPPRQMNVVIPSFESLQDLQLCVDSISGLDEADTIRIIVVDNNSSSEVKEWLTAMDSEGALQAILLRKNYGFTHAVNEGIRAADPDADIVLMNNDAIPVNGSLKLLSAYSQRLENAGLLVPAQLMPPTTPSEKTQVHVPYARPKAHVDVNVSVHHDNLGSPTPLNTGEYYEVEWAPFFCCYIPRQTIETLGLLDAELGRHYRSDRLYSNSVRNIAKQTIYYIPGSRVSHHLQRSTQILKSKSAERDYKLMFIHNRWDEESKSELGFEDRAWF